MKKLILSLTSIISALFTIAQTPKLDWAKRLGGYYDDFAYSIAIDAAGNVYTTGTFTDSADFDPGVAKKSFKSAGAEDIFISKIDVTGKFVWSKQIGGADKDAAYAITIDATGNLLITGGFIGSVDFDPGTGTKILTSASNTLMDIFVAKYDQSGNYIWAKGIGGILNDYGSSLASDASGNVYVTGFFYSTVDFDPDAGTVDLSSSGNSDIFILKLDATGKFAWAKNIGSSSSDAGRSIALDANANVYTTGSFSGTADFDPGLTEFKLTSSGTTDIFVSKLDVSGNFVWAKNMGGTADEEGTSITVTSAGLCCVLGKFTGTADFDPSAYVKNLISIGDKDAYIFKLDALGNLSWVQQFGGLQADLGQSICLDATGNIYATGSFKSIVDFDPGTTKFELTSLGFEDIFILKIDGTGKFVWAKRIGDVGTDVGQSITVSRTNGTIYIGGYFNGTVDFDPDAPKLEIASEGLTDIFIEKIILATQSIKTETYSRLNVYPNPVENVLKINFENLNSKSIVLQIMNSLGQIVIDKTLNHSYSELNIEDLSSGVYYIKVMDDKTVIEIQKIVKY